MKHFHLKKNYLITVLSLLFWNIHCYNFSNMVEESRQAQYILQFKNLKRDHNLSINFIKFLKDVFGSTIFVETGTLMGGTAYNASQVMEEVHTIELSENLYREVVKRFAKTTNVFVYQGDSSIVLPQILKTNTKKCIFWLDGHFSEGITAKGDVNTPILAELNAIKNAGLKDSVILIDDIRCFQNMIKDPRGTALEGYPELQVILDAVLQISQAYKFALIGDILMCYIPQDNFSISAVTQACTLSRICLEIMKEKPVNKVIEETVNNASLKERKFIEFLFNHYKNEHISQVYGLNKFFNLWYEMLSK